MIMTWGKTYVDLLLESERGVIDLTDGIVNDNDSSNSIEGRKTCIHCNIKELRAYQITEAYCALY